MDESKEWGRCDDAKSQNNKCTCQNDISGLPLVFDLENGRRSGYLQDRSTHPGKEEPTQQTADMPHIINARHGNESIHKVDGQDDAQVDDHFAGSLLTKQLPVLINEHTFSCKKPKDCGGSAQRIQSGNF